ncbi:MAG TPA: hypothetical protein VGN27_03260, partial [Gaiellaceae bacterium]|nr:hypothetical protein [Gaiellaceae bacterium]
MTGVSAAPSAVVEFDRLSFAGRHRRGARLAFALVGLLSFAVPYTLPALRLMLQPGPSFAPAAPAKLPVLVVPGVGFPTLGVPKLPSRAQTQAATAGALSSHHPPLSGTRRIRLPIVKDRFQVAPPAPKPATKTGTIGSAAPLPPPVVTVDVVGAPPADAFTPPAPPTPAAPASNTTTPPPATDPATPPDATAAPATDIASTPAPLAVVRLQIPGRPITDEGLVAPPDPAASLSAQPAARVLADVAPAPAADVIGSSGASAYHWDVAASDPPAPSTATVDPPASIQLPPTTVTTTGSSTTTSTIADGTASATSGTTSGSTPTVNGTTTGTTTQSGTTSAGDGSGTTSSVTGATTTNGSTGGTTSSTQASTGTTTGGSGSGTQGTGVSTTPPDPASVPGSGRSPPAGTIDPATGGTAATSDGAATVSFGSGLVANATMVSVVSTTATVPAGIRAASSVFDLTAIDSTTGATISHFTGSPVLTISYDPSGPTPTAIYYLGPNGPEAIPSTIDAVAHTISAALPHFSDYVAGSADVQLSLTPVIAQSGPTPATITATVKQGGVIAGKATVTFTVSGSAAFVGGTNTCQTADADGTCSVTITDAISEVVTIGASVGLSTPLATDTVTLPFVGWSTTITGTTAHDVSISVDTSSTIHVNVAGGTDTTHSAAGVTSIGVIGSNAGDNYTIDATLAAAGITVFIAGGTGADTLVGPNVNDTRWTISGVNTGSAVAGSQDVVAFTGIEDVTGGNLQDTFTFLPAGQLTQVDGGGGADLLDGPNQTTANAWIVDAKDEGTLNGMNFKRFGSLGGGTGPDMFTIGSGVELSGGIAGGTGPEDIIDFIAGTPTDVTATFSGPGAGSVSRDGKVIDYGGIEQIQDGETYDNLTLTFSTGDDGVRLDQSGDGVGFWVQPLTPGAFATALLSDPATALSIQTLDGADRVMLDSFSPSFPATISIDTGAGNDTILVALPQSLGANVTVNGGDGVDSLEDLTLIPDTNVQQVEILTGGIPSWVEQGPGPITATSSYAPYSGAVESLAIDPFNESIMYAGTVNGGIWFSDTAGATWTPLTDRLPTLAIGSLTIAPRDAFGKLVDGNTPRNELVIYAGTGSFSSFSSQGGLSLGLLRSMDGGNTWTLLATQLAGIKLGAIVALDNGTGTLNEDPLKQIVVVAGMNDARNGGIFRSTDSGKTFTPVPLASGAGTNVTDLVADPGAPGRLYAGVVGVPDASNLQTGGGVYRSDDRGATFTKIAATGLDALASDAIDNNANGATGDNGEKVDGAGRIVLAVGQGASTLVNPVYAALLSAPKGVQLMGVFVSTPGTTAGNPNGNWALLGNGTVVAAPPRSATLKNGGSLTLASDGTIVRTTGDWQADGFAVGQTVTITNAVTGANNGTYTVSKVETLKLTLASASFSGPADTTAKITGAASAPDATDPSQAALNFQPQVNTGGQGDNHFAMAADAKGNVYVSGDTLGVGGNVYVFTPKTSSGATSNAWTELNAKTLAARAYPDSRDLLLDAAGRLGTDGATSGHLFDSTDGGISKLTLSGSRQWESLVGGTDGHGLATVEIVSAAFDPLNDLIFMGAQDAGLASQDVAASDGLDNNNDGLVDDPAERLPWTFSPSGDGNTVLAVKELDSAGKIVAYIHYVMGNNLDSLTAITYDENGAVTSTRLVALAAATVNLTVTLGTDKKTFTAVGHDLVSGEGPFVLMSTGALPGGATATDQWNVSVQSDDTFFLLDSTGTAKTFNDTGGAGATLRLVKLGGLQVTLGSDGKTFTVASGDNLGLTAGAGPFVMRSTGDLPGNASLAAAYYIQPVTGQPTKFTLRFSATSTTDITFTAPSGTPTLTLYKRFSGLLGWDAGAFTSGYKSQIQYAVNAADPKLMMLGLTDLYASTDGLDTVRAQPNGVDKITALAFGGTVNGAPDEAVLYAAAGNTISVLVDGTEDIETIAAAKSIYAITLDTTDATVAYAVTDAGVFKRTAANTWTDITGNLPNVGLRSATFIAKGDLTWASTATQHDVLLVGGNLGVFRAFDPGAGSTTTWTAVGANLPDAMVESLSFTQVDPADYAARRPISVDDVLLAGTLGRGAWTLMSPEVSLALQPTLTIKGTSGADTILIARDAANPGLLSVTVNGRVWTAPFESVGEIDVLGNAGADTLTIDSTNGSISVPGGIFFTGGTEADSLILKGAKVEKVDTTGSTSTKKVFKVVELGAGSETVTFTDFGTGADPTPDTSGLATPSTAQEVVDTIARWAGLTQPPAPQLAVFGVALPRALRPQAPPATALPTTGTGRGQDDVSSDAPLDPADPSSGISRMFTFADGSTLLDKVNDGTITDVASLLTQLGILAGHAVTNTGTDAFPRIVLNFTKTYTGSVPFSFAFDKFGGHVQLSGSLEASIDFTVNLVVGVDASGLYIETGDGPQLALGNIQVQGNLDGSGQFGFLGVELKNATLAVNGVGVALTLTAASGNQIRLDDLLSGDALAPLASVSVTHGTGPDLALNAEVSATAVLPGSDAPFDIGTASFSATWADITQPTNVNVTVNGALGDFLKARVDQILSVLTELRDASVARNEPLPGGFDKVVSLLQAIDTNVVHAGGSTSSPTFSTVQQFAGNIALGLQSDLEGLGLGFQGSTITWDLNLGPDVLATRGTGFSGLGATLNNLHIQLALDLSKITGGGSSFSLLNAFSFTVTGDVSDLNVFNVLQGGAKFQVSSKAVDVNVDGGAFSPSPGGDLHGATLTTFGIDLNEDPGVTTQTRYLTIGTSDANLTLQDGVLAVAVVAPADSADTRQWVAVKGVGIVGLLNLGGVITAAASGDVSINSASGGATALDWVHAIDLDNTGTTFVADPVKVLGTTIDLSSPGTTVSGTLSNVNVANVLSGSTGFSVTDQAVKLNDDGNSGTTAIDATLLAVTLTGLQLRVGTADVYASVTGGPLSLYSVAPTAPDGRSWLAVDGSGLGGSIHLGTLASGTLSALLVRLNRVTGSTYLLDWRNDVTSTTVTLPSISGVLTQLSGHVDSLAIGSFVRGSADFDLSKSLVNIQVGAENLAGAILLTFGLSNLDLTVGDTTGVYLDVKSGTLAVASLTAPAPSTGTDTRSWLVVAGSVGTITFHGVTGVDLTVSSLNVKVNTASGTFDDGTNPTVDASALDWTHALDLNANGTYGDTGTNGDQLVVGSTPIDLTSALVAASGSATVKILDFVTGAVTFDFQQKTVNIDANNNGTFAPGDTSGTAPIRGPPDVAGATLTTLGLTIDSPGISIGVDGGPRLTATGGTLALALVTPPSSASDTRSWLALTSDIPTVSFSGFSGFDAHGSNIHIQINQAQGAYTSGTPIPPLPLNWQTSVLDPSTGSAVAVTAGTTTIGLTSGGFDVTGTLGFDILGFVLAQGTLHIARDDVTITDPAVNGGAATAGTLLRISVTGGDAFVGTGASFSGSTLVHGPGAVGFYLSSVSFDAVFVDASTGETFLGLQASIGAAGLQGIPDVELHLQNASVEVSRSNGSARLDWANALAPVDSTVTLPAFTMGSDVVDRISGGAALSIGGVVAATTNSLTLDHLVLNQTIGTIVLTNAETWSFGLDGARAFVGPGASLDFDGTWYTVHDGTPGVSASVTGLKIARVTQGTTTYTGVDVSGATGDLVGIGGIEAHVRNVSVKSNTVSPSGTKLDFTSLGLAVDDTVAFHLAGDFAFSVAGVVAATGSVTLDHTTPAAGDVWAFDLTSPSLFAGTGASLDVAGSWYAVHNGTVGVSVSADEVKLARIVNGSAVTYVGVQVINAAGDLIGIPAATAHVRHVDVTSNTASSGAPLDFTALAAGTLPFALPVGSNVAFHLSGDLAVSVAGVVAAVGTVTLDHTTVATGTLAGADVWAIGVGSPSLFVGTGGSLTTAGSWYTVGAGPVGVSASASTIQLATITQGSVTYTGLKATGLAGDISGLTGLVAHVAGGTALSNTVTGATTKLGFSTLAAGVLPASFDLSGLDATVSLHLSGAVAVSIAGV